MMIMFCKINSFHCQRCSDLGYGLSFVDIHVFELLLGHMVRTTDTWPHANDKAVTTILSTKSITE